MFQARVFPFFSFKAVSLVDILKTEAYDEEEEEEFEVR